MAKYEHMSHGNTMCLVDRLVRTLKEMLEKYRAIVAREQLETAL